MDCLIVVLLIFYWPSLIINTHTQERESCVDDKFFLFISTCTFLERLVFSKKEIVISAQLPFVTWADTAAERMTVLYCAGKAECSRNQTVAREANI